MADALKLRFADEATVNRIADLYQEPDWMRADRHAALKLFHELPVESNPLFTLYVDLRQAKLDEIEPYVETGDASSVADVVPEGAAALIEIAEGRVVARALSPAAKAAGVVVDTLTHGLPQNPDLMPLVRQMTDGGESLPADDKLAQVARALAPVGVLVHVPKNVVLDDPIVLRWGAGTPGRGLISRTLVNIGENAQVKLLEEQVASQAHATADDGQSLWWGTSEVQLARGANLSYAAQQDFAPNTLAFVNRHATLDRDAHLRWALASVGGAIHKSRIDNRLVGRGSGVSQVEIGFGDGKQLFDLTSYTRHIGEDTTGDLLSKGVFLDRARGYFKGMITIERSAKGTDSFLGEFAMLLAKAARSVTIPSLEIDQPDVRRASHSSSVGPIDENEIFYLMSRGIPRELARKFIVLGFLEPVVARIPLEQAQERLRGLLDAKWPSAMSQEAA
ncbi:MAG: Fe-S cluster assembly protein SufB [Chloroflexota bacterium]|jgi:Fe-S cluster assembly protein SufB/Fe-S cluster assembly protein SufD|nr:Fe-S cluster assembly protein SufB [Chloroflexota bacterium]